MEIDLKSLPKSMKHLKRDDRGIPVPWFVDYIDGKPEFRAMDRAKFTRALRGGFCWVCGGRIHTRMCFVAGPMCGINRISAEPPSHVDCARWSAFNCPFLNTPKMVRREDDLIHKGLAAKSPGMMLTRNPGCTMLWFTRSFEVIRDNAGGELVMMGEPESVEWYREGRPATRAEVQEAIDTGMPFIIEGSRRDGTLAYLDPAIARFQKWLPAVQ